MQNIFLDVRMLHKRNNKRKNVKKIACFLINAREIKLLSISLVL